jgi:hypothetical protein
VVRALEILGFEIVREREHIAMARRNADGTTTPLTIPNHRTIKGSTLRTICNRQESIAMSSCECTIVREVSHRLSTRRLALRNESQLRRVSRAASPF